MGIGNSTAAAALCARSFAGAVAGWVGPGTGVDGHGVMRKAEVIERGLAFHSDAPRSAFETLRRVGGREIADRKSTRLTPVTNAHLVCRLLLHQTTRNERIT